MIKESSRKLGMTINDLFTAALSVGVKKYMKKRNDPCESLQLVIPAAVRWEFYQTFESVKLENKFAAFPVKIPLVEDLEEAIPQIQKVTKIMKASFGKMYASYILSILFGTFLPELLLKKI